jgi:hypothetical protein
MRQAFAVIFLTMLLVGCGDQDKKEAAKSQLEVLAHQWDAGERDKFKKLDEKDPWGNQILVSISKKGQAFELELRSTGHDGLPYNDDDVVVTRTAPITDYLESWSQSIGRGLSSGAVRGIKDGLKKKQ